VKHRTVCRVGSAEERLTPTNMKRTEAAARTLAHPGRPRVFSDKRPKLQSAAIASRSDEPRQGETADRSRTMDAIILAVALAVPFAIVAIIGWRNA
jgi:hypothetical protein